MPATSATGEPAGAGAEREAGATLLEMLVVVAILGLVAGLTLAGFRPVLRSASLAAARGELVLALAHTRAVAMREGQPRELAPSQDGATYLAAARVVSLPPGVRLASDPAVVSFDADGRSPGARLVISAGRRRLGVVVPAQAPGAN